MNYFSRVALSLILLIAAAGSLAQQYPVKPVRVINTNAAGGPIDILGRLICERLAARLGQNFVTENRPGAFAVPALTAAARAIPDGYTLLFSTTFTQSTMKFMYTFPFDVEKELVPVALTVRIPFLVLVSASSSVHSLKDLAPLAKTKKDGIMTGSIGPASLPQISLEMLRRAAGFGGTYVPYKASQQVLSDIASGALDVGVEFMGPAKPLLDGGRLRAIAITTAARSELAPDIPALGEQGFGDSESTGSLGILAPAKTPQTVIDIIARETTAVINEPAVRRRLLQLAYIPDPGGPEKMQAAIDRERAQYLPIVRALNLKLD